MHREEIEIELEVTAANLPIALAQVAQIVAQADLALVVRQLADFQHPVSFQVPNLTVQSTPKLENNNGKISHANNP